MRLTFDAEVDALDLRLDEDQVDRESEQVLADVIVDFDKDGRIAGVEVLDASPQLTPNTV